MEIKKDINQSYEIIKIKLIYTPKVKFKKFKAEISQLQVPLRPLGKLFEPVLI